MELKKLEVPTSSITRSETIADGCIAQARDAGTGVYIFNREKVAGVMLTQEQYETLLQELDVLRQTVKEELEEPKEKKYMKNLSIKQLPSYPMLKGWKSWLKHYTLAYYGCDDYSKKSR